VEGESEFPVSLGKVVRRELAVHGITRFDQLTSFTASDLLQMHRVGSKAVRILAEELEARGLAFAA
jgi:predicted flap endonuclease-1-like 5' DNA nuclease